MRDGAAAERLPERAADQADAQALAAHDLSCRRILGDFAGQRADAPGALEIGTPPEHGFSLSKAKGLTLKLKPETCAETGNPAFIGKRQQHMHCSAETELTFAAKAANETAGLVAFQDEKHFYYLCKSTESGKPVVVPQVSREPLFLNRTGVWKESGKDELTFICVT